MMQDNLQYYIMGAENEACGDVYGGVYGYITGRKYEG